MKVISELEGIIGKTIVYSQKIYDEETELIMLITSDNEIFTLESQFNFGLMDTKLKQLDFYDTKKILIEHDKLYANIKKLNPDVLKSLEDEIFMNREEIERAKKYELYQELKKEFEE